MFGNSRAEIFWSDDDRQRFLGQLAHHLRFTAFVTYDVLNLHEARLLLWEITHGRFLLAVSYWPMRLPVV